MADDSAHQMTGMDWQRTPGAASASVPLLRSHEAPCAVRHLQAQATTATSLRYLDCEARDVDTVDWRGGQWSARVV
jgi:hypothetical protein